MSHPCDVKFVTVLPLICPSPAAHTLAQAAGLICLVGPLAPMVP